MYKILALTSLIALAQARGEDSTTVGGALGADPTTVGGAPAEDPAPVATLPAVDPTAATSVQGNLGGQPTLISTETTTGNPGDAPDKDPAPVADEPAPVVTNTIPQQPAPVPQQPTGVPAANMPLAPPVPASNSGSSSAVAPDNQASNGDVYDAAKHDVHYDYGNKKIEHHDIASHLDAHTQPMCAIGGEQTHQDLEKPTDYCCRIYELRNFYGRYYDTCYSKPLSSGDADYFELSKFGWHEEVSSWKCGAKVEMQMCDKPLTQVGENSCPVGSSESGGRNSSNAKTHFDNSIDFIKLTIAKGKFSATIYEEKKCQGRSQLLRGGNLREGSWNTYKGTPSRSALLTAGTVNSVFLDELTDISFYSDDHFLSDQWTVRNYDATKPVCIDLDLNPFGEAVTSYNFLHSAWVHKNWFPNADAVPNDSWKITT